MNGNKAVYLATLGNTKKLKVNEVQHFTWDLAVFLGFTPLSYNFEVYPGDGLTLTRYLEESHITIDTYPEAKLIELTVVSCKYIDVLGINSFCQKYGFTMRSSNLISKQENGKWLIS